METLIEKALHGIIGSGPLAALLLYAVWTLWKENKLLHQDYKEVMERQLRDYERISGADPDRGRTRNDDE